MSKIWQLENSLGLIKLHAKVNSALSNALR